MGYLERYLAGEHEQVWNELQALGPTVREQTNYSEAWEVALETMRRVRRNCERLISKLGGMGYVFGTYPDGSRGYYSEGPLVLPSAATRADSAELEKRAGHIPLSLAAFWQEVGSVDFVGMTSSWPRGLDPLVVYPPAGAIYDLDNWESLLEDGEVDESEQFEAGLAPDELHKDNISGGDAYAVALPNPAADFVLLNERHDLLFVSYLRLAILQWGGFPGLDDQTVRFAPLEELVAGLERF